MHFDADYIRALEVGLPPHRRPTASASIAW
jgi:hypothetical protein